MQTQAKHKNRRKKARDNVKQPKRYYNFTDPDSRMMIDKGQRHLIYGYNAQAAVDGHAQVIVSAEFNAGGDGLPDAAADAFRGGRDNGRKARRRSRPMRATGTRRISTATRSKAHWRW
ncbi:MAG: hypothetical protein U5J83_05015 [Bryobacterales bacterium]|nr:hypothetical protein [Bryobacterales bacterium]